MPTRSPLVLFVLMTLLPLSARAGESIGENPVPASVIPSAICVLSADGGKSSFCTATLARLPAVKHPVIVTAAHCTTGQPSALAFCGCKNRECAEGFKVNFKEAGDSILNDYAYAKLDHKPRVVEPLDAADIAPFLDVSLADAGMECIKGGYGIGISGQPVLNATMHELTSLHSTNAVDQDGKPLDANLVVEVAGQVPTDLMTRLNLEIQAAALKSTGQPIDTDLLGMSILASLVSSKFLNSTITPGDSGGGLLCRKKGENWKLVGMNSAYMIAPGEENQTAILNNFGKLPAAWLEKR